MEKDVWRVAFTCDGAIRIGDMVLIDGHPHLVWEWHEDAANEYPGLTLPLDRKSLQPTPGTAEHDFVYNRQVQAPDSPF
jgi:hypothetical protein